MSPDDPRKSILAINAGPNLTDKERTTQRQDVCLFLCGVEEPLENGVNAGKEGKDGTSMKKEAHGPMFHESVKCAICLDLCVKPITVPCQHNFCLGCLEKWMAQGTKTCPTCRMGFPSKFAPNPTRINTALAVAVRLAKEDQPQNLVKHHQVRQWERVLRDFYCQLCSKTLKEPVSAPCSHNFCKTCLDALFRDLEKSKAEAEASEAARAEAKARARGQEWLAPFLPARARRERRIAAHCPQCMADISELQHSTQVNTDMADVITALQAAIMQGQKEAAARKQAHKQAAAKIQAQKAAAARAKATVRATATANQRPARNASVGATAVGEVETHDPKVADPNTPDGHVEATPPDRPVEATPPVGPVEATLPDGPLAATPPDGPLAATPPLGPVEATPPDGPVEAAALVPPPSDMDPELALGLAELARDFEDIDEDLRRSILEDQFMDGGSMNNARAILMEFRDQRVREQRRAKAAERRAQKAAASAQPAAVPPLSPNPGKLPGVTEAAGRGGESMRPAEDFATASGTQSPQAKTSQAFGDPLLSPNAEESVAAREVAGPGKESMLPAEDLATANGAHTSEDLATAICAQTPQAKMGDLTAQPAAEPLLSPNAGKSPGATEAAGRGKESMVPAEDLATANGAHAHGAHTPEDLATANGAQTSEAKMGGPTAQPAADPILSPNAGKSPGPTQAAGMGKECMAPAEDFATVNRAHSPGAKRRGPTARPAADPILSPNAGKWPGVTEAAGMGKESMLPAEVLATANGAQTSEAEGAGRMAQPAGEPLLSPNAGESSGVTEAAGKGKESLVPAEDPAPVSGADTPETKEGGRTAPASKAAACRGKQSVVPAEKLARVSGTQAAEEFATVSGAQTHEAKGAGETDAASMGMGSMLPAEDLANASGPPTPEAKEGGWLARSSKAGGRSTAKKRSAPDALGGLSMVQRAREKPRLQAKRDVDEAVPSNVPAGLPPLVPASLSANVPVRRTAKRTLPRMRHQSFPEGSLQWLLSFQEADSKEFHEDPWLEARRQYTVSRGSRKCSRITPRSKEPLAVMPPISKPQPQEGVLPGVKKGRCNNEGKKLSIYERLYHPVTHVQIAHNDVANALAAPQEAPDSGEDEDMEEWKEATDRALKRQAHVQPTERHVMLLWNYHMRVHTVFADSQMPAVTRAFVRTYASYLARPDARACLSVHLLTLCTYRLLTPADVDRCLRVLDGEPGDDVTPSRPPCDDTGKTRTAHHPPCDTHVTNAPASHPGAGDIALQNPAEHVAPSLTHPDEAQAREHGVPPLTHPRQTEARASQPAPNARRPRPGARRNPERLARPPSDLAMRKKRPREGDAAPASAPGPGPPDAGGCRNTLADSQPAASSDTASQAQTSSREHPATACDARVGEASGEDRPPDLLTRQKRPRRDDAAGASATGPPDAGGCGDTPRNSHPAATSNSANAPPVSPSGSCCAGGQGAPGGGKCPPGFAPDSRNAVAVSKPESHRVVADAASPGVRAGDAGQFKRAADVQYLPHSGPAPRKALKPNPPPISRKALKRGPHGAAAEPPWSAGAEPLLSAAVELPLFAAGVTRRSPRFPLQGPAVKVGTPDVESRASKPMGPDANADKAPAGAGCPSNRASEQSPGPKGAVWVATGAANAESPSSELARPEADADKASAGAGCPSDQVAEESAGPKGAVGVAVGAGNPAQALEDVWGHLHKLAARDISACAPPGVALSGQGRFVQFTLRAPPSRDPPDSLQGLAGTVPQHSLNRPTARTLTADALSGQIHVGEHVDPCGPNLTGVLRTSAHGEIHGKHGVTGHFPTGANDALFRQTPVTEHGSNFARRPLPIDAPGKTGKSASGHDLPDASMGVVHMASGHLASIPSAHGVSGGQNWAKGLRQNGRSRGATMASLAARAAPEGQNGESSAEYARQNGTSNGATFASLAAHGATLAGLTAHGASGEENGKNLANGPWQNGRSRGAIMASLAAQGGPGGQNDKTLADGSRQNDISHGATMASLAADGALGGQSGENPAGVPGQNGRTHGITPRGQNGGQNCLMPPSLSDMQDLLQNNAATSPWATKLDTWSALARKLRPLAALLGNGQRFLAGSED